MLYVFTFIEYGKCSKILKTFLFLFSALKMFVIRAKIHKIPV